MTHRKRRSGVLPTIGLIVEGDAEFAALPLLHRNGMIAGCPPMKVINLGGVGSHLAVEGIAKMLAGKVIAHAVAGRDRVVICLDREQRTECAGEFAIGITKALTGELQRRSMQETVDVTVVVADRSFEA